MTTTKSYYLINRLTSISSTAAGSTVASSGYQNNSGNQRVRNTQADGSYWVYEYDPLGQVGAGRKFWADGTPVAGQQFEYAHDDIGNRRNAKAGGDENGASLRSASYAPNALNQYTSRTVPGAADVIGVAIASNGVTVAGLTAYRKAEYFRREVPVNNTSAALWTNLVVSTAGQNPVSGNMFVPQTPEAFVYDFDGNLTSDGRFNYTWDAENRLIKVESLATSPTSSKRRVTWEFDAKGRRIRQTTYDGSSGSYVLTEDLKFVSDGWRHIAELNAANNALVRSYLWGLDLSGSMDGAGGVGGLLLINSAANGAHFTCYDGNGNVSALVTAQGGTVTARYEYGPFGEPLRLTGSMAKENPFRFSTKRGNDATDVVLYEYRVYIPSTGKWLTRDPLAEEGQLNLTGFCQNNPVDRFDSLGQCHASVHRTMTETWAYEASFNITYAAIIGEADQAIDSFPTWSPPWPIGEQGRHMRRTIAGGDSRDWYFQDGRRRAADHLRNAERRGDPNYCAEAAQAFGAGLHSLQDRSAHRSWPGNLDWQDGLRTHPSWWGAWTEEEITGRHAWPFGKDDPWWNENGLNNNWGPDYLPWYGDPAQIASQAAARAAVRRQSSDALATFAREVRRNCLCRTWMLRNL